MSGLLAGMIAGCAISTAGGALTAKQRAIKVGPIAGDSYPVLEGVKPGERIVVSGAQKLADGAPIAAQGASPAPQTARP